MTLLPRRPLVGPRRFTHYKPSGRAGPVSACYRARFAHYRYEYLTHAAKGQYNPQPLYTNNVERVTCRTCWKAIVDCGALYLLEAQERRDDTLSTRRGQSEIVDKS